MSDKTTVLILFLVFGLPPGLCSLYFAPETILMLRSGSAESRFYGMVFGVPCLIGFLGFVVMLCVLIWAWRRTPP